MEVVQHAKRLLLCRLHFVRCVKSDILQEMHELRPYDIVHCVFKYAGIVIHPCHMALIEVQDRRENRSGRYAQIVYICTVKVIEKVERAAAGSVRLPCSVFERLVPSTLR